MQEMQGWIGLVFSNEPPIEEEIERIVAGLVIELLDDNRASMSGFRGTHLPDRTQGEMILDGLDVFRGNLEQSQDDTAPAVLPDYAWLERFDDLEGADCMIAFDTACENFAFGDDMDDAGWSNGCLSVIEGITGLVKLLAGIEDEGLGTERET